MNMRKRAELLASPADSFYESASQHLESSGTINYKGGSLQEYPTMAHIIAEPCIGTKDTACVDVCPVDCIHPTKDEDNFDPSDMLYIDPDTCIDCGLCVDECPVQAIYPEEDLPEEWTKYIQINIDWYENQ